MPKRLLLALALTLPLGNAAQAQGTPPSAAGLSGSIFKLMNQVGGTPPSPAAPATGGTKTSAPPAPAAPTPVAKPDALKFKISPAIRQQAINAFVGEITAASPESGAEWDKLFKSADVFAEIDKQMNEMFGLKPGNLADTWALYWGYAYQMTRASNDDPTRAQMTGLRNQMQTLLLAIPQVTSLTDAEKQKMSDTFLLQVGLFGVLAEAYKDDPASAQEFGDGLAEGSRQMGFDLSLLTLTDKGFVVQK